MQDVPQDSELCTCLKTFEGLSCGEISAGFTNITSITTYTRKITNHTGAKPLMDSIFHIKDILDFQSSKDEPYINLISISK